MSTKITVPVYTVAELNTKLGTANTELKDVISAYGSSISEASTQVNGIKGFYQDPQPQFQALESLSVDLEQLKIAHENLQAADATLSSLTTSAANLISSGPQYGVNAERSLVAESQFTVDILDNQEKIAVAKKDMEDKEAKLGEAFRDVDDGLFDLHEIKNDSEVSNILNAINPLGKGVVFIDDAGSVVGSLSLAIEALNLVEPAQQAYADAPSPATYSAWVNSKSAVDSAMEQVATAADQVASKITGITHTVSDMGDGTFTITYELSNNHSSFSLADVSLSSGTLTNLIPLEDGYFQTDFKAIYTPDVGNVQAYAATYIGNFKDEGSGLPEVVSVELGVSGDGSLAEGSTVVATVMFSEPVSISNSASIELLINPNTADETPVLALAHGSIDYYSDSQFFLYTLPYSNEAGYVGPALDIGLSANSLTPISGTIIEDRAGNSAELHHTVTAPARNSGTGTPVDYLTSISVLDMDGRNLNIGEKVVVIVEYSEAVIVTGNPDVEFGLQIGDGKGLPGGHSAKAEYLSGNGTSTLTFVHDVTGSKSVATLIADPFILQNSMDKITGISNADGTTNDEHGYITLVNDLDYGLTFPSTGTTIATGDPSGDGSLLLQQYSGAALADISFETQGLGVTHIMEGNVKKFVATQNSDGTVLIDGTAQSLGKVLLKDVTFLTDAKDNIHYISLEDYIATESDASHEVSGSFFGGDVLVVNDLAGADLVSSWNEIAGEYILSDASHMRAKLVESPGADPSAYTLTTYMADGTSVLQTYSIKDTEVLSIEGLTGNVTKDLGPAATAQTEVNSIEVTSSATKVDEISTDVVIADDVITVSVNFSEAVFVTGQPTIQLQIGGSTVTATYAGHANHTFTQDENGTSVEFEAPYSDNVTPSNVQAFKYTVTDSDVGSFKVALGAGGTLVTASGSILNAAGTAADLTYDSTNVDNANAPYVDAPPTVTIEMDKTVLIAGDSATVTFTFSEAVEFPTGAITADNGTLSSLVLQTGTVSDPRETYKATYTPTPDTARVATNAITIDMSRVEDIAGNAGKGTTSTTINYTVDTRAPTVTIKMDETSFTIGESSEVTFTFSEAVQDPTGAITADNGTLSLLVLQTGTVSTYKATYTPTPGATTTGNGVLEVDTYVLSANVDGGGSASFTYEGTTYTQAFNVDAATTMNGLVASINDGVAASTVTAAFTSSKEFTITKKVESDTQMTKGTISGTTDGTAALSISTTDTVIGGAALDSITIDMAKVLDSDGNTGSGLHSVDYFVDTASPTIDTKETKVSFDKDTNTIKVELKFSEHVELAHGKTAQLTLLIDDDTGISTKEVVVTAIGKTPHGVASEQYTNTYTFESTDPLISGLFDTDGIMVNKDSLKNATDNAALTFTDRSGNPVITTFDSFRLTPNLSIDSRTNRDAKEDAGYLTFSDLLPATPSSENKILDEKDAVPLGDPGNVVKTITGGVGMDQIFGGAEAEHLIGGSGNDFLKGGGGNDILEGGLGDDYLYADIGDDEIKGSYSDEDTILFDNIEGGDSLDLDLFKDVSAQATHNKLGTNTISGIKHAIGTDKGDVMNGNGYDNIINGADGNDIIKGGRGNDELLGGAGNDTLKGGRGNDTLEGGLGSDKLYGGSGEDTFKFTLGEGIYELKSDDSDTVYDFNHYADTVQIVGKEAIQYVHLKSGKLFINEKTEHEEYNSGTDLLLADNFNESLQNEFDDLSTYIEIV